MYYANYKNLSAEIESYHASISVKQTLIWYAVYVAICIGLGLLLKIKLWGIVVTSMCSFIFVPFLILHTYKNAYEQRRFSDISQYMQQLMYSFKRTGKIRNSLEDVKELFDVNNPIVEKIDEAIAILDSPSTDEDVERQALKVIENEYFCEKLRTIHKYLIKVENIGGTYQKTLDILLEDRTMWVDRVTLLQATKKKKKREVTGSIIATIILCALMGHLLMSEIDITTSIVYQIASVVMLIIDMAIYTKADKRLATDWLSTKNIISEETTMANYEYVTTYDISKERKKSLKYLIVPVVIAIIGCVAKLNFLYIVAGILVPIMLTQHRINYALSLKELKKEINLKFPRWLMDITLILQSKPNVQSAIFDSIDTAPIVLVPELNAFCVKIAKDPTSPKPFLEFMKDFNLPEVQASMKMLYSLQEGNGTDVEVQVAEIIERNNKILDKVEQEADEDSLGMLYMDFLAPQLVVGGKILVDIVLYTIMYLPLLTNMAY